MKQPKSLAVILSTAMVVLITGFAAIIALLRGTVPATPPPIMEKTAIQAPSSCAALTGNQLAECCNKEAASQNKVKASCVGNWKISNEQCSWVCATQ
jgi:hypothetical protein